MCISTDWNGSSDENDSYLDNTCAKYYFEYMWIINVDTVMHSRSLLKSNSQMTGDITFVVYMCLIYI